LTQLSNPEQNENLHFSAELSVIPASQRQRLVVLMSRGSNVTSGMEVSTVVTCGGIKRTRVFGIEDSMYYRSTPSLIVGDPSTLERHRRLSEHQSKPRDFGLLRGKSWWGREVVGGLGVKVESIELRRNDATNETIQNRATLCLTQARCTLLESLPKLVAVRGLGPSKVRPGPFQPLFVRLCALRSASARFNHVSFSLPIGFPWDWSRTIVRSGRLNLMVARELRHAVRW